MWETHTNPMISLKFIENGVYHKLNVSIENLRNGDGTTIPSAKTEFTDSVSDVPASNIYTDKIWYRVIKYEKKNSKTNAINVTAIHCKILTTMEILDLTVKFITSTSKVFEHSQELMSVKEYQKHFPYTIENMIRLKQKSIYCGYTIKRAMILTN